MKTSLLILAVVACACAVYAFPEAEERHHEDVQIDLDKLAAQLSAEFADEKFLEEKFGNIAGVNVQLAGKFGWMKKLPWGKIIDAVVDGVRKALEPKDKKD